VLRSVFSRGGASTVDIWEILRVKDGVDGDEIVKAFIALMVPMSRNVIVGIERFILMWFFQL